MRRYLAALILLAGLVLPSASARCDVTPVKSGAKTRKTTDKDWLRHPDKHKYYTESWTMAARSRDGHIVYLNFIYTNLGVFAGSAAVNVSYSRPGKSSVHLAFEHKTSEYGEDPKIGRIGVGASWIALKGRDFTVKVKESQFKMDLQGRLWADGVKVYGGRLELGEDAEKYVDIFYQVPRASVTGTAEIDGQSYAFEGDAYLDHMVQNALGTDYASHWYVARFFHSDYSVVFITFKARKELGGKLVARVMVTGKDGMLLFTDSISLSTDKKKNDPKGHDYATRYKFKAGRKNDPVRVSGTFTG
ncbi:MAG: hypothetical protein FJ109_02495 [Deltaproteobacteria bacterium]|nr:hypothetical protein [Deltaproteobacteria bacterium]